jgi:peptidoglycan/xylan/chitin deacetylase (PgdA/CDA1 family)
MKEVHNGYKESHMLRFAKPIAFCANHSGFLDLYRYIKNNIIILCYHRVGPYARKSPMWLSAEEFEKQLIFLKGSYEIVSMYELMQYIKEKPIKKKLAAVTFDDGYKDNYIYAFPILRKYKIPATFFLTSGHIGTDNLLWFDKIEYVVINTKLKEIDVDYFGKIILGNRLQKAIEIIEKLKQIPEDDKNKLIENIIKVSLVEIPKNYGKNTILSWDEVKIMSESGIDFGSHTVTHPILKNMSLDQIKYEISWSKKTIESKIGKAIYGFSYPNGTVNDFDKQISSIVKNIGFEYAVTMIQKMVFPQSDLYELGRLYSTDDFNLFKFYISGLYTDLNGLLGLK